MLDKDSLKPVLESLIFAADSAISFDKLSGILEGEEKAIIREALNELIEDYRAKAGGFLIEEVANGFQFRTNPEFAPWLRKFFKIGMQKISKAAMESLAVVAYKQPVTRGEIEAVRGVDSGGVLATLMEKRFIKIVGRKEVPGRPVVYGTTKEFLETFDLKDLSCLPTLKDIQKMEEEYAQKEGQGTAETTVEDRVQGAENTQGGVEDEIQESIQDGTARGPEGEELQASAEDEHGDDWEETDSEEMGSGRREERPESGTPGGRSGEEDAENGSSDSGPGETEPEDGAPNGRPGEENAENGTSDSDEMGSGGREASPEAEADDETGPGEERPESGTSGGRPGEENAENGASGSELGEESSENGASYGRASGETPEDGASGGRPGEENAENGASGSESGEESSEDGKPGRRASGEAPEDPDAEGAGPEERRGEGEDPDSETES
jgi:segregation and condensation protein B